MNRFPPPPNLPPLGSLTREELIDMIHRIYGGWAASVVSMNDLADNTERLMESIRKRLPDMAAPTGGDGGR